MRREDPKSSKIPPSLARQRNAWRADDGPTLNAVLVALCQGIGTSIDMKPYIFLIFQGGSGQGSAHVLKAV